jgi:uncharacterized membrane protein
VALVGEAVATVLWGVGIALLWKRTPRLELALWVVVWVMRGFGSLCGARYVAEAGGELELYTGLQWGAGVLLVLAMVRAELRVCREKLAAHLKERIQG